MAKKTKEKALEVDFGSPNSDPQWNYFLSEKRYNCYGGARGGGKSWATQRKSCLLALNYPGIKILIIRREYSDMENSIIDPILSILPQSIYSYNKTEHRITFSNGSIIKFGNMPGYGAAVMGRYQGQEHDILFMEEATQFLENEFRGLDAIVRGTNNFPKRVYLTCNPGGVGHTWVKRLFVDRKFKADEDPEDYAFFPATVDDNVDLIKANPQYIKTLENLPPDIRAAHRHGDWNILAGIFFKEFQDGVHTCDPFPIPKDWVRYRAFDYGLDMFFCIWVAVDENGRSYVYREYEQPDMVVSDAARKQLMLTGPEEHIEATIAPPDMWSRNRETGKTQAEVFSDNGVGLLKASNSRVQGWSSMKEAFRVGDDGRPDLIIFDTCKSLIDCLKGLQHSTTDPNDVSKEPHGITHGPDALRYFIHTRTLSADKHVVEEFEDDVDSTVDYHTLMCGGSVTKGYIYA